MDAESQSKSESRPVMSDSLRPHGLYSPRNSPGQNTGVGTLSPSRGSSQPRDQTQVPCIAGRFFTSWATREAQDTGGAALTEAHACGPPCWGLVFPGPAAPTPTSVPVQGRAVSVSARKQHQYHPSSISHSVMSGSLWPHDCSPPGSSVHGILQVRILERAAMPSSSGSYWPRDRTCVFVSCTGRQVFHY